MIGKKLGGRYEILERIGGGGMALVYKGVDLLLHRKVAVKVLRQQYVHDEEFIRRFRREAQAAASLSHPNVVSIYDVGQEGEIHYIVMEYIEGTTLNDLIKEKAPLQVEDAVHYAGQIADALDHAHHNEIIHRDIKPHNILIGKNGRVKVTDFGIARAATSSTITQTGSVVGSVHYFSPEHAKGTNTGEKSDLYSLGIVMYQMLTGKLPFLGESPISVALKHLQEDVEEPRKVNPLIPQSVENVILKAMRKKPEERYQSAKQMQEDLETCLKPDRRNEPKIVFWDIVGMDEERTLVMPAIRANQLMESFDDDTGESISRTDQAPIVKKKGWVKPVVWIVILLIILGAMWFLVGYVKEWAKSLDIEEVDVPNVINLTLEEAETQLKNAQLVPNVIREESKEPKDKILSQDPPSGMKLHVGTKVDLHVSKGVELLKMTDFKGKKVNEVITQLTELGVKDIQITSNPVFSEEEPETIIEQDPVQGTEFDPETVAIKFNVSKGPEPFKMPDLVGLTEKDAKEKIAALGLKLPANGIKREKSYKQPKGRVIEQFPFKANQDGVKPGDEVSLFISDGLPDEAGQMILSVHVKPSVEGKASTLKIVLTDAQYTNFDYKTQSVSKETSIDVAIVLSPDTKAVIQVKEGDKLINSITKTYQDYLDQKSGKTSPSPSPNTSPKSSPETSGTGGGTIIGGASATPKPSPGGSN